MNIFEKLFGTYSSKEIKRIEKLVNKIEGMEPDMEKLSDNELKAKTPEFKKRLEDGEKLDNLLPEAFAVCREASKRVLGMRHFRVQLIGGIILHQGRIAEMKTGEGKTLVATLPVYLNALTGKGVHVVTVNDYLAKRDSEWMGKLYNFLGLSVGVIIHGLTQEQKVKAYNSDITYGTNNEFGFDYLRDNMVIYKKDMVQRDLMNYAIVDEIDSILIDEARTPLIISGPAEESTELYTTANKLAKNMKAKYIKETDDKEIDDFEGFDYVVDEKAKSVSLTPEGTKKVEEFFGIENLSDPDNLKISHHINQAIKAHGIFKKDINYVVKDGEVIIVDEFTGRLMYGRRYNDGLHQAIEAKENVKVARESKTYATITFQNYFRMYKKLAGMTGTAMTEDEEFRSIYKLDVVEIPTNKPIARLDQKDVVYKNEKGKFDAVVEDIIAAHEKGQPVLVGTISIEKSEVISSLLKKKGIKHEVLNAKYHEKEAEIIAQAGKYGAITIATNMAGRGTDIVLGGNPEYLAKQEMKKESYDEEMISAATSFYETDDQDILNARAKYKELYDKFKVVTDEEHEKVLAVGGLKIIGTERHESRRIDNQLRGRAGRQGDPGETRFYISLEDDLMRLFGSDRIMNVVEKLGLEDDTPIENRMLSNTIESAQKRVEGRNFNIRKHVLQYDDVMNQQREVIYNQRKKVLDGENLKDSIINMIKEIVNNLVDFNMSESVSSSNWNLITLASEYRDIFGIDIKELLEENSNRSYVKEELEKMALEAYEKKEEDFTSDTMRELERIIMLTVVDQKWMDHIDAMDQLKESVGLRAYGQRDPVVEYKFEGYEMFEEMTYNIKHDTVKAIMNIRKEHMPQRKRIAPEGVENIGGDDTSTETVVNENKIGRNDPCPCGSGKKYKNCCGRNQ